MLCQFLVYREVIEYIHTEKWFRVIQTLYIM